MERLYKGLSEKIKDFNAKSGDVRINMSIGYAFSGHSLGEMGSLFIEADGKMYQEKRAKKQQPVV